MEDRRLSHTLPLYNSSLLQRHYNIILCTICVYIFLPLFSIPRAVSTRKPSERILGSYRLLPLADRPKIHTVLYNARLRAYTHIHRQTANGRRWRYNVSTAPRRRAVENGWIGHSDGSGGGIDSAGGARGHRRYCRPNHARLCRPPASASVPAAQAAASTLPARQPNHARLILYTSPPTTPRRDFHPYRSRPPSSPHPRPDPYYCVNTRRKRTPKKK